MTVTSPSRQLPPGPRHFPALQGLAIILDRRRTLAALQRRFGPAFTVRTPLFGPGSVVITDPALVRQLFTAGADVAGTPQPNLGRILGPGSIFALDGGPHRARRKLLVPPFHGRRLRAYDAIIEEETRRESDSWPLDTEFASLPSFMRITVNVILRAVFGARGRDLDELRRLLPDLVTRGSRLALLPVPATGLGRWNPWLRYREQRLRYNAIAQRLVADASADPDLDRREDVLAMMVRSSYEDGSRMSGADIADELLTLLAAGHETTATTLAWAVERLRRHPEVLARLVAEADRGGQDLLQATVLEVQRTRPVVVLTARRVIGPALPLGDWVIPHGSTVIVGIELVQQDETVFAHPDRFDPDRFLGAPPDSYSWIPFGGGLRRCLGASFANLEMTVVLRTLLTEFDLRTTDRPGERWRSRGVAYAPARGGRIAVRRRRRPAGDAR